MFVIKLFKVFSLSLFLLLIFFFFLTFKAGLERFGVRDSMRNDFMPLGKVF